MTAQEPLTVSLFQLLQKDFGDALTPVRCTKATLVHLSHTLEDMVLRHQLPALLFTGFQESSHWREETERYRALAAVAKQVCIFAGGKLPPESSASELHVVLRGEDPLRQEWFLALLSPHFSALLCGQDRHEPVPEESLRQFDTFWTFEPAIIERVLDMLETVIGEYRPERLEQLQAARREYPPSTPDAKLLTEFSVELMRYQEQLSHNLHIVTTSLNEQLQWREDLTAMMVHDMRTPLQGLSGAIDLMGMGEAFDAATLAQMLDIARRSARGLTELVQLILDTSRLAAGHITVSWHPFAPQRFIKDALAPLEPLLLAHKLNISVNIDQRVSSLWADAQLLQRVVQNLVGNAVKFTPDGGDIAINVMPAPTGEYIEIHVRDSGKGIPPTALPHIFNRYYRERDGSQGIGLGLYFCRLALEAHGGSIRATSQLGRGTTVTALLPIKPPQW